MENGNQLGNRKQVPGSLLSDDDLIDITPANNIRLRTMSGLEDGNGATRRSPSHNGYNRGDFDHDGM